MKEYVIVELIPTSLNPNKGDIIQLSALKINDLKIIDRFDYRLIDEKIPLKDLIDLINYDKESFIYKNTTEEILSDFKCWIKDLPLLIIDNSYTKNYLKIVDNKKESIFNYLNTTYSDDVIEKLIKKYNLQPSNYIVDLLFESLIYESNNVNK